MYITYITCTDDIYILSFCLANKIIHARKLSVIYFFLFSIKAGLHKKRFIASRRAPCVFCFVNTTRNVYTLAHATQCEYRQIFYQDALSSASGQSKPVSHEYNHVL